jgi:dephospho-CoA kinase
MKLTNTIIYLFGFAGSGKYTIAKELAALSGAKLVDNHLINNPIFSVIEQDGMKKLPEIVWEKTWAVRKIVLDTIETVSPPEYSFVFTNQLCNEHPDDHLLFGEIEALAKKRGSLFIPVRILCEVSERTRRIVSKDRKERMKTIDPAEAIDSEENYTVLEPKHPNTLTLDVTRRSPLESAAAIIKHIQRHVEQTI